MIPPLAAVALMLGFVPPLRPHLCLHRTHAIDLLKRWKPQRIGGRMVYVTGEYTRARLQLEPADRAAFAFVDDNNELDLFVVAHRSNRTELCAVAWHSPRVHKCSRFCNLRRWYSQTFPHCTLEASALADRDDQRAWQQSSRR